LINFHRGRPVASASCAATSIVGFPLAAFERPDVGAVHARRMRERLLRKPLRRRCHFTTDTNALDDSRAPAIGTAHAEFLDELDNEES
jgi:hypothetical protein